MADGRPGLVYDGTYADKLTPPSAPGGLGGLAPALRDMSRGAHSMSGSTGTTTADRQRMRSARGSSGRTGNRMPAPPRQRRPALAAIAVLLIVGGALVAGLLAIRMDSRVQVIAVSHTLEPGHRITAKDLVARTIAT